MNTSQYNRNCIMEGCATRPMFDTNYDAGFIVDQVDPLDAAQFRSNKNSGLETQTVVNNNIISAKEVRAAHKAWTEALVSISQTNKKKN